MKRLLLSSVVISALSITMANAGPIFVSGSDVTISGVNSPDSFTDVVPLTAGTVALDGGKLNLTISFVPQGSDGSEWVLFDYSTADGSPLVAPTSNNWALDETGVDVAVPADFTAAEVQFFNGSTALTPTGTIFGGYSVQSNPVPGGSGMVQAAVGFTDLIPAGPVGELGTFINPFSFLAVTGIDPTQVTGYEEGLLFQPQTPIVSTPEPASLALLGFAVFGLTALRRRKEV